MCVSGVHTLCCLDLFFFIFLFKKIANWMDPFSSPFQGCTIALVEKKSVNALLEHLTKVRRRIFRFFPCWHVHHCLLSLFQGYPAGTSFYTAPSDGARKIDLASFVVSMRSGKNIHTHKHTHTHTHTKKHK